MSEEKFDRIIGLLEEILKWTKLQGLEKAQNALTTLLHTDSEKLAYENSDGKTSREVSAIVGVSHVTIANYWKKWARYGIVTEVSSKGGGTRYKRIFSLQDFGIDFPKNTEQSDKKNNAEEVSPI
jgi:Fic family protein